MEKTLDQELENAFLSLDEKAVKSLLAAGADKNGRIRNKMLIRSMSEPPHLHNILPTDSDQEKKRTKKWNQEELKEAKKNLAVIKLLLANGANPNWVDPNPSWYNTCLMESLELGNCKQAQLLVDNGAKVNMRYYDDTPFTHFAHNITSGGLWAMKFLYKNGANINARNTDDGQTALIKAIASGFDEDIMDADLFADTDWLIEPVEFLVSKGAKVNLRDKEGKTAISHSMTHNWEKYYDWDDDEALEFKDNFDMAFYYEIPKILLSNGARISIADKEGKNTLDIAKGSEEKMDLLARAIDDANKFLRKKIIVMSR